MALEDRVTKLDLILEAATQENVLIQEQETMDRAGYNILQRNHNKMTTFKQCAALRDMMTSLICLMFYFMTICA